MADCIDLSATWFIRKPISYHTTNDPVEFSENVMLTASRNGKFIFLVFILAFPLIAAGRSGAETRYISDQLTINIRDNLERPYQVVAKVRSNEAVNVLEENDSYARIQTADNQVGWIGKQYLTATQPKPLVIEQLQKEVATLKAQTQGAAGQEAVTGPAGSTAAADLIKERDRLQTDLQAANGRIVELQDNLARLKGQSAPADASATGPGLAELEEEKAHLESEITALRAQLESLNDGTVDLPALLAEKENLLQEVQEKDSRIATLTAENTRLARRTTIYWFCAGALVFLIGMFSGKMFGRKKAKYSY
jgi:SH3 domain protein